MSSLERSPLKIMFISRSLEFGGAERQLISLAKGLRERQHQVSVAIFYGGSPWEAELTEAGVDVHCLDKAGRWDVLKFIFRLSRLVRRVQPEIIHGYLAVPNIMSAMLRPLCPNSRVVWGLRASNMPLELYDWVSRLSYSMERYLSRFPDLIIANSQAGMACAAGKGYPSERMLSIHNGVDTRSFLPQPEAGARVREQWGVGPRETLIGLVARFDPMKDHATFFRAAALLREKRSDVRFVCVGAGPADYQATLRRQAEDLGLNGELRWIDAECDMAPVYNALDLCTLSSSAGEGFPNVVAEAMACGVPCVVTDVGDTADIVGSTGVVVPPGDPAALAQGWATLLARLATDPDGLRCLARERIAANYSEQALVRRSEEALLRLL